MYCLTFKEGDEIKTFYYHNLSNAVAMQRALLINEIDSIVDFCLNDLDNDFTYDEFDNQALQKILELIIKMVHREEKYQITVDIVEIKFEDKKIV